MHNIKNVVHLFTWLGNKARPPTKVKIMTMHPLECDTPENVAKQLLKIYFNGGSYVNVVNTVSHYWCDNVRLGMKYFLIHREAGVRYFSEELLKTKYYDQNLNKYCFIPK